jgi:uncharacterized membrane protein
MKRKVEKLLPVIATVFLVLTGFLSTIVMAIGGGILLVIFLVFLFRKDD